MLEDDEEVKAAARAFEEADDLFNEDFTKIYGAESDRLKLFFNRLKANAKGWEKPGPCLFQSCTRESVRRSHTLHRAGPLERIAEDQHVLTPTLGSDGKLVLAPIGVHRASTF